MDGTGRGAEENEGSEIPPMSSAWSQATANFCPTVALSPPDLDERVSQLEEKVAALRAQVERQKGRGLGHLLTGTVVALGFVALILLFTG